MRCWLPTSTASCPGSAYLYKAAVARDTTRAGLLRRLLDSAFEGSAEGLVMTLLSETQLAPEEARRIREKLRRRAEEDQP